MNHRQRIVAFVGLLVIAGMLLYPPFEKSGWPYRLVFFPPSWVGSMYPESLSIAGNYAVTHYFSINTQLLGFQCVIVALITIAMLLLLGTRKPRGSD